MSRILALVEGETERDFINTILAEHFGLRGVTIQATLPGRVYRHGGVPAWESARRDLIRHLSTGAIVTTAFDFYGMPSDWPGRIEAAAFAPTVQRAHCVEAAIQRDLMHTLPPDSRSELFVPYVQLHEFEALVFVDPVAFATEMVTVDHGISDLEGQLRDIVQASGSPEAINDHQETSPSHRIKRMLGDRYRKPLHGVNITRRVGLSALRLACPHFSDWISRLENVASST